MLAAAGMTVGVLLLAAGRARRFGSDKRLATTADGRVLLDVTLAQIRQAELPVLVCLAADDTVLERKLRGRHIPCHRCTRANEGMGATLAEGIGQVPTTWRGAIIALADMPWVQPATYRALAEDVTEEQICVPVFSRRRGNPVAFGRSFFPRLAELGGDEGARALVRPGDSAVRMVRVKDRGVVRDVDTPKDLR